MVKTAQVDARATEREEIQVFPYGFLVKMRDSIEPCGLCQEYVF